MSIIPPPSPSPSARSISSSLTNSTIESPDPDQFQRTLNHFRNRSTTSIVPDSASVRSLATHVSSSAGGSGNGIVNGGKEECNQCTEFLDQLRSIQGDLHLSASIGQSLLNNNEELKKQLRDLSQEKENLTSKLSTSLSESRFLSSRLAIVEEDLKLSETSNASLLRSIKESHSLREEMRRKLEGDLKRKDRECLDLKDEVEGWRKEVELGKRREGKLKDRLEEERKKRTEESKDLKALLEAASANESLTSMSSSPSPAASALSVSSLLSLLSSLESELSSLRSENLNLQSQLSSSRENEALLLQDLEVGRAVREEDEEDEEEGEEGEAEWEARKSLLSEVLLSGGNGGQSGGGLIVGSPTETEKTTSWGGQKRGVSVVTGEDETGTASLQPPPAQTQSQRISKHTHYHYHTASHSHQSQRKKTTTGRTSKGHNRRSSSLSDAAAFGLPSTSGTGTGDERAGSGSMSFRSPRDPSPLSRVSVVDEGTGEDEDESGRITPPPKDHEILGVLTPAVGSISPSKKSGLSMSVPEQKGLHFPITSSSSTSGKIEISTKVDQSPLSFNSPLQTPNISSFPPSIHSGNGKVYTSSILSENSSEVSLSDKDLTSFGFGAGIGGDSHMTTMVHSVSGMGGVGSGAVDNRTALLGKVIDHGNKLLGRLKVADVNSLEKRLKKQNLTVDVKHLAQSTLKDLLLEIEDLRSIYRQALEQERKLSKDNSSNNSSQPHQHESLVTRRDFHHLLRLMRELLLEAARLRSLLNKIELDPSSFSGSKVREMDVQISTAEDLIKPMTSPKISDTDKKVSTPGLLAPFSRLFGGTGLGIAVGGDKKEEVKEGSGAKRPMPKGEGITATTSANVNVTFGNSSVLRRAVSIYPLESPSPPGTGNGSTEGVGGLPRVRENTLNRQGIRNLNSIFAGGIPGAEKPERSASGNNEKWVLIPSSPLPTSSQEGTRIHSTSEAMMDPTSIPKSGERLLDQTLRPRGLSDSSIRSTFLAHASKPSTLLPSARMITPASLAASAKHDLIGEGGVVKATPVYAGRGVSRQDVVSSLEGSILKGLRRTISSKGKGKAKETNVVEVSSPSNAGSPVGPTTRRTATQPVKFSPSTSESNNSIFDNLTSFASKVYSNQSFMASTGALLDSGDDYFDGGIGGGRNKASLIDPFRRITGKVNTTRESKEI